MALDILSFSTFCSLHAITSSVIYYSTHACKNKIYLLNVFIPSDDCLTVDTTKTPGPNQDSGWNQEIIEWCAKKAR